MWIYNKDNKKWEVKDGDLSKSSFDTYKQELSSTRFYAKCLSGATYLPTNDLSDIYDTLKYKDKKNWFIPISSSQYSDTSIPIDDATPIESDNSDLYYDKNLTDYNLTLKNKFTPNKLIKDSIDNYYYVDISTIEQIDITDSFLRGKIDGVRLLKGHRILVKDQKTKSSLDGSIDPDTFFVSNYTELEQIGLTTEYEYYNEENGIYEFDGEFLIKQSEFDDYEKSFRYSVVTKLGTNVGKQFHLSRLLDGYYPNKSEPKEFLEKKNWMLRNKLDYNNICDRNYYESLKHSEQSIDIVGITYSIPERTISVGEFGVILDTQNEFGDISNIIKNKFKVDLFSITETELFYWTCGQKGTLLKVNKHDFKIEKIKLPKILVSLNCVRFLTNDKGIMVGDNNTILITNDGGNIWEKIDVSKFSDFDYNKCIYYSPTKFFVVGENGVFIEFEKSISGFKAYKRRLSKFTERLEDEYLLVDDINDIISANIDWDIEFNGVDTNINDDFIFITTNDNNIIMYDINENFKDFKFLYLNFNDNYGDITNIVKGKTKDVEYEFMSEKFGSTLTDTQFNFINKLFLEYTSLTNFKVGDVINIYGVSDTTIINDIPGIETTTGLDFTILEIIPPTTLPGVSYGQRIVFNKTSTIPTPITETTGKSKLIRTPDEFYFSSDTGVHIFSFENFSKLDTTTGIYNIVSITPLNTINPLVNNVVEIDNRYYNDLFNYNGEELILSGNESLLKSYDCDINSISLYDIIDSEFYNRNKSKMLFMNYDIASKLNFFRDNGEYRLPEPIELVLDQYEEYIEFENTIVSGNVESNWINYWQDSLQTFEYNTIDGLSEATKVLFSTRFELAGAGSYKKSILPTDIAVGNIPLDPTNVDDIDISDLAPDIENNDNRFYGTSTISAPTSTTNSNPTKELFLYKYLMIVRLNVWNPVDKGDVIRLTCDDVDGNIIIETNLIINKIETFGSYNYMYMYTEFNDNIIKSIKENGCYLDNLNKYLSIEELEDNFKKHPLSIAYDLKLSSIDSSYNRTYKISAKFNNKTAYYNLGTTLDTKVSAANSNTYSHILVDGWKDDWKNDTSFPAPYGDRVCGVVYNSNLKKFIVFRKNEIVSGGSDKVKIYSVDPKDGNYKLLSTNTTLNSTTHSKLLYNSISDQYYFIGITNAISIQVYDAGSTPVPIFINEIQDFTSPATISINVLIPHIGLIENSGYIYYTKFAGDLSFNKLTIFSPSSDGGVIIADIDIPTSTDTNVDNIIYNSTSNQFFITTVIFGTSTLPNKEELFVVDNFGYYSVRKIAEFTPLSSPTYGYHSIEPEISITGNTLNYVFNNTQRQLSVNKYDITTELFINSIDLDITPATNPTSGLWRGWRFNMLDDNTDNLTLIFETPDIPFRRFDSNGNEVLKVTSIDLGYMLSPYGIINPYLKDGNIGKFDPITNTFIITNFTTGGGNIESSVTLIKLNKPKIFDLKYTDCFVDFGYSPIYNIYDYLRNINSVLFTPDKEYLAMPVYKNIPLGSLTPSVGYIDTGISNNNKILLGTDLKFEWESVFIDTFIDVDIVTETTNEVSTIDNPMIIPSYIGSNHMFVDGGNGFAYSAPGTSGVILKLNLSNDTITTFGSYPSGATNLYYNGVLSPTTGKIYFVPSTDVLTQTASTPNILVIDPTDDSESYIPWPYDQSSQFNGLSITPDGIIYLLGGFSTSNQDIIKIDTNTENITLISTPTPTGTASTEACSIYSISGYFYLIVNMYDTIYKIDPTDDSVTTISATIDNNSNDVTLVETSTGIIYGIFGGSSTAPVFKIDTSDDSVINLPPLPTTSFITSAFIQDDIIYLLAIGGSIFSINTNDNDSFNNIYTSTLAPGFVGLHISLIGYSAYSIGISLVNPILKFTLPITYSTEKLLVMDKYYDEPNDAYAIEFHKKIEFDGSDANILNGNGSLNIISRRKLSQISDDLRILNNIHRSKKSKKITPGSEYFVYDNELTTKIKTNSYTNILLSDQNTKDNLTAVIYTDDTNELSMNILNLDEEINPIVTGITNLNGRVSIVFKDKHNLSEHDLISISYSGDSVLTADNGCFPNSSAYDPNFFGSHVISISSPNSITLDIPWNPSYSLNQFTVSFTKTDSFLDYTPVDLVDIGVDQKGKTAIELLPENSLFKDNKYELVNVDFNKFRYRLFDGLTINDLIVRYSWILEAEISNAAIGLVDNELTWYSGIWECGRWFEGNWMSGQWMSGDFYGGTWNAKKVIDKKINIEIADKKTIDDESIWHGGRWFDGTWNGGVWRTGRWYAGDFNSGKWLDGIWNDGTFNNGNWNGGIWVLGTWNNGVFNTDNKPSYWIDGKFNGGDFGNGIWYNGTFESKNTTARFGTESFNSRPSIWHGGDFLSGSFHSFLDKDSNDSPIRSKIHKYSVWNTGNFISGDFYGGVAYNIDFRGTWHGGILEDIQIIEIDDITDGKKLTLNGIFKYNIGDEITIMDKDLNTFKTKVYLVEEDSSSFSTKISTTPDVNLTIPIPFELDKYKIVSEFNNTNWKSGIWTNGVFNSGLWEGGMFYDGIFNGVSI